MASPDHLTVRTARGLTSLTNSMLQTGRYSDLTIKCWEREFKVHRAIICLQSKPLAVRDFIEAETGVIELEADEPEIIEKMVSFFYSQDYFDVAPESISNNQAPLALAESSVPNVAGSPLLTHAKVYVTAEKYDVPALKALSKEKYNTAVSTAWDDLIFTKSMKLIYEETPESDRLLRDIAAKAAAGHLAQLLGCREFLELCKVNGEVGVDILKASLTTMAVVEVDAGLSSGPRCKHCGSTSMRTGVFSGHPYYCQSCHQFSS